MQWYAGRRFKSYSLRLIRDSSVGRATLKKESLVMSMFMKAMGDGNHTLTENGALTNKSTFNTIVDFFFHGAALRSRPNEAVNLFQKAFDEDPTQALRILFYVRDVRGGQGERNIFRTVLRSIATSNSTNAEKIQAWFKINIYLIPAYGRWDDLFIFMGTALEDSAIFFIKETLKQDCAATHPTLLAKWMPSENTSSEKTRKLASYIRKKLNMTSRQYRKLLSTLRRTIEIIETNLTNKDYTFDYAQVPSKASLRYRKAFARNDNARYSAYLEAVNKGEKKINTSTLYPYDLLHTLWRNNDTRTADTMWKNLPDYVDNLQGLVVADTSGSMNGRPMEVSVSLAMYIAERNKNEAWKDYFISFSERPKFHKITGDTLAQRARSIQLGDIANTNIQAVFDLILARALSADVLQEDMPKILLIISDMEFDSCARGNDGRHFTNFEMIKKTYRQAGYEMPTLVFWNVNSRNTQTPVTINDKGVVLISGCSPVVLKYALGQITTPMQMVYNVTNSKRYNGILF